MLTTVLLYGHLRQRYGKRHQFDLDRPAQAISALRANFRDFDAALCQYQPGYRVMLDDHFIESDEELQFPFTTRRIKIVPIVAGAGGAGRILAGIALIAASIFLPGSTPFLVKLMAGVQSLGVSLVLGGISQLLFSPPKVSQPNEASEDTPNYSFNGAVNTLAQGQCVPVLYGRLIVGGATVSFGIHLEGVNEVYQPEFDPALIAPMRTFTNQVNNALFGFATLAVGFNGSQRE